jgi:uncharacterized protein YkwD
MAHVQPNGGTSTSQWSCNLTAVYRPRHRGGTLLLGITTGVLLIGGVALAAPPGVVPADWHAALGVAAVASAPAVVPMPRRAPAPPEVVIAPPPLPAVAPQTTPAPVALPTTSSSAPANAVSAPLTRREVLRAPSPAYGVVTATNTRRQSAGCPALKLDPRLTAAAQRHASDMAAGSYFSHTSQNGTTFDARIRASGYRSPGGENIAQGQQTEAEVVGDWMASPGHRRNIVDCSFTAIGVGFDSNGNYWVQDFGR